MSKKMIFRLVFMLLSLVFFVLLAEYRTDGFRTFKIISNFGFEIFDTKNNSKIYKNIVFSKEEVERASRILNMKFYFLSKGNQFYVFESQDHRYVIKFINFKNFSYPSFLKKVPLKVLEKSIQRKDKRYPLVFSSIALAYEKLKDETGLVFVNLNQDIKFEKQIILINKFGVEKRVALDDACFVLQKKASSFFSTMEKRFKSEGGEAIKKGIDEFFETIEARCRKNIADEDANDEMKNVGIFKNKVLITDIGKLYYNEKLQNKSDFLREMQDSCNSLRDWLNREHREELIYLDEKFKRL